MERLFNTTETGERIGGLSAAAVLELIRRGKLRAKPQVVRGKNKRPHLFVTASEIERYIRDLPDATGAPAAEKTRAKRTATGVRAELATATRYY